VAGRRASPRRLERIKERNDADAILGGPAVQRCAATRFARCAELRRQCPDSVFVFATERGGPFTPDAVNRLIKRVGERADFACSRSHAAPRLRLRPGQCWPRHATHPGLAGNCSIQHTTRYTQYERGAVQRLLEVGAANGVKSSAARRGLPPLHANGEFLKHARLRSAQHAAVDGSVFDADQNFHMR